MITELSRVQVAENRIAKLINIESEDLENQTKSRVKEMLAQDAQHLLQRKRREQEKKERLRRMEEQFEKRRTSKIKLMEQKNMKSEKLRSKNKQETAKKLKLNSKHHDEVTRKIAVEQQNQLQRKLDKRRQYLEQSRASHSFSKTTHNTPINNTTSAHRPINNQQVEQKLKVIEYKAMKAQMKHSEYQNQLITKMRSQSKNINQAQKRAQNLSMITQSQALRNQYEKNSQMERIYHRTKSLNEKKIIEKRRTFKDKLDKCSQNLRHLSYLQQEKFQQLQNKFEKQTKPKLWKDPRTEKYLNLFTQNSRRIEAQKQEKAEQILMKHQQITQQNKIYKERKDKLIEAIKHG